MKRLFDFAFAILFLVVLFLPMAIVAVIIIIVDRQFPLFLQERSGLCERPFVIFKFKTMTNISVSEYNSLVDVGRETKLGTFLRKYSLDELPQLFNILRGDMSFVGPRPLFPRYSSLYTDSMRTRFAVRPGITGLAQIRGRAGISWRHKFQYDIFYAKKQNLRFDIKIIALTLLVVIRAEGVIVPEGNAKYFDEVEQ